MIDFKFSPKSNGKKEKGIAVLYAAIAVVAFIFGMLPIAGKGIIQLVFVIFVALDIMHCIKYFLTTYTYSITDEYGDAMIVVTQTQGKRISTLANFKIGSIRSMDVIPAKELTAKLQNKYGSSAVRYNYCVTSESDKALLLTIKNDYTRYIVVLTYNDEFYSKLCEVKELVGYDLLEEDE